MGVPLITPGAPDGLGEGDGDPEDGVAIGLGDGRGVGVGGGDLMVKVPHAGVEPTEVSTPHTMYEPGVSPLGGAVGAVELVQIVPAVDGIGLLAQFIVFPNDHVTWS